jgi:hypothetical protein
LVLGFSLRVTLRLHVVLICRLSGLLLLLRNLLLLLCLRLLRLRGTEGGGGSRFPVTLLTRLIGRLGVFAVPKDFC